MYLPGGSSAGEESWGLDWNVAAFLRCSSRPNASELECLLRFPGDEVTGMSPEVRSWRGFAIVTFLPIRPAWINDKQNFHFFIALFLSSQRGGGSRRLCVPRTLFPLTFDHEKDEQDVTHN